jgi:hypothetical protein
MHQSTDDLRDKLRAKLAKLVNPEDDDDAVILDGEVIDVDAELGLGSEVKESAGE